MAKKMKKLMALILTIVMVMGLSVNAFAAHGLLVCDETPHTHGNACYECICPTTEGELELICGKEVHDHDADCHLHNDGCYTACEKLYDCDESHEHGEGCPVHTCNEACEAPTCGLTACAKNHAHVEGCYAPHVHGDACYNKANRICNKDEYAHSDSCYTIWHGDKVSVAIEAGQNGYVYRSHAYFVKEDPNTFANYETSNHTLDNGGNAVSLLTMVPADRNYTWTPDGVYEYGKSNYDVLYCCDKLTTYEDGIYYKRVNLEDSDYYSDEEAAHIRGIVTNSYPYVSLEQMRANLKAGGFEYADKVDRSVAMTAVQAAIWYFANQNVYSYNKTTIAREHWGRNLHDFLAEMNDDIKTLGTKQPVMPEYQEYVNELIDYLKKQTAVEAKPEQIVISTLEVEDTIPVQESEGTYKVVMQVGLNGSGSHVNDDINLTVYVDGVAAATQPVVLGIDTYDFAVEAQDGQSIKAVVSGTQFLEKSVYFYEPAPADVDGDGVATSREVSQNMVGVAEGATDVYAEAAVTLDIEVPADIHCDLTVQKVDNRGAALAGAAFELFAVGNETVSAGTFEVNENGQLVVEGLLPGNYELKEVQAPAGYVALGGAISFTIDEETGAVAVTSAPDGVAWVNGVLVVENDPTTPSVPPYIPPYNPPVVNPPAGGEEELPEGDVPTTDAPEGEDEIFDEDVPLAGADGEDEIFDEDVPLADVPATGDMTLVWAAASVVSAAGVLFLGKKNKEDK